MSGSDLNPRHRLRLGDLLILNNIITEAQLQEALQEQKRNGQKLGRTLVKLGMVAEDELLTLLSRQLNLPIVSLKHYHFDPRIVRLLPEAHSRRYRAIVLAESPERLSVGMVDPTDIHAYDALGRRLQKPLDIALVREAELLQTIDLVYRRTEEISSLAEELGEELSGSDFDISTLNEGENVTDAPVIKLLQTMFEDAVQVNASDIHIEPDEHVLRIRQRVDGELQEQIIEGRRIASALVTRLKLMASLNISEKRLPQDGRFSIRVKERNIDVRLSTMPIQHGESVVMRLLDQSAGLLQLDALGIPDALLQRLYRILARPTGMLLVTGPTGSGKTTTLYAALNAINTPARKIITAEDPVEYRLPRINQVHVNNKIGLDFARVLRSILRQDPDIIMIGEMRDHETMEIGLRAAMSGHMVLSTLHTTNAPATVMRLLDMGAEGYLVAAALDGVLAQRLVRRVCESCSEPTPLTYRQQAWVRRQLGEDAPLPEFRHGRGCPYCSNTGYRGRIGVYELLELDARLTDALRPTGSENFTHLARQQSGYRSLVLCALDYARHGLTSLEEVMILAGGVAELRDNECDAVIAAEPPQVGASPPESAEP